MHLIAGSLVPSGARPFSGGILPPPGTLALLVHRLGALAHRSARCHFAGFPKHPGPGLVAAAPGAGRFGGKLLAQHRQVFGHSLQRGGVRPRVLGAQAEPSARGRRVARAQRGGPRRIVPRGVRRSWVRKRLVVTTSSFQRPKRARWLST